MTLICLALPRTARFGIWTVLYGVGISCLVEAHRSLCSTVQAPRATNLASVIACQVPIESAVLLMLVNDAGAKQVDDKKEVEDHGEL